MLLIKTYVIVSSDHHTKLEDMINQLSTGLTAVKHEQEYMEVRERVHRSSKDVVIA